MEPLRQWWGRACTGLVLGTLLIGSDVSAEETAPLGVVLVDTGIGAAVSADGTRVALASRAAEYEGGDEGYQRNATAVSVYDMTKPGAPRVWAGVVACESAGKLPPSVRCPSNKALAGTRKQLTALLSKMRYVPLHLHTPPPITGDDSQPNNWTLKLDGDASVDVVFRVDGASVKVDAKAGTTSVFTGELEAPPADPALTDAVTTDVLAITGLLPRLAGAFVLTSRREEPGSRSFDESETWHLVPFSGIEPEDVSDLMTMAVRPLPGESFVSFRARLPWTTQERNWIAATEKIIKLHCAQMRDLYAVQVSFQKACQGDERYEYVCKPNVLVDWQRRLDAKKSSADATLTKLKPLNTQAYGDKLFGAEDAYVAFLELSRAHYCPRPPANPWFDGGD